MQFYGIPLMHPYKQSCQWQDVFDIKHILPLTRFQAVPAIDQTGYWMHEINTIKLHVQVNFTV